MNYYKARQKVDTKKWHYTCANDRDDFAYPIGPCASGCEGHDTAEEAQNHYKEGLIENAIFVGPSLESWPKNKCHVCEKESTFYSQVSDYSYFTLCEDHANRETLKSLVVVGESWSS